MKILTTEQIRQVDAYTIAYEPILSIHLMERAALKCVNWFRLAFYLNNMQHEFVVCCGPGNNGGDGLVIARHLKQMGQRVRVVLIGDRFSEDNLINQQRFRRIHGEFLELQDLVLNQNMVVIDALFGSGLDKPVEGKAAELIGMINRSGCLVVSIDVPSGLMGDELGEPSGQVVRAHHTLTFHCPKWAFLFPQSGQYAGRWEVLDIGLLDDVGITADTHAFLLEESDIRLILPLTREVFTHKGTYGHAVLCGGSAGKPGAIRMSGMAALRAGCGLVTIHTVSADSSVPELMWHVQENDEYIDSMPPLDADALAFGPGAGTMEDTARILKRIIQEFAGPLVIDADGLNILAENPTWLSFLKPNTILTPHPGEFARLAGKWNDDREMFNKALEFARKYGVILVLKGSYSLIASPDGRQFFNAKGNAGMAKGGSGDILTGIITSFCAQGVHPLHAAMAGIYLHGLAADIAVEDSCMESLIATDIIRSFDEAIKTLWQFDTD